MIRRRIAIVGLALLLILCGVGPTIKQTDAAWTVGSSHSAQLMTGIVNPVTSLTCAASGLLTSQIAFAWAQPVITGRAIVPTSYTVVWSGSAGSGQKVVSTLAASIPVSTLRSMGTNATVVVYANASGWTSVVSTQSRTFRTTLNLLGVAIGWTCT